MMDKGIQRKSFKFEIKAVGEKGEFEGYASTFGNIDAYDDTIEKGAYEKTIKEKTPVLLWQHDPSDPIGVIDELKEDETGLYMKAHLLVDKVKKATEAYELLKAGAIKGLSIGFVPVKWEIEKSDEARWGEIRRLTEIDLWEVSLVTFPADSFAGVTGVKSIAEMSIRDIEDKLRDAGFSRNEAKALISRCKQTQRDVDDVNSTISAANRLIDIMKG